MGQISSSELIQPDIVTSERAAPEAALFVDTIEHTLDSKFRLTLPAAMRPAFIDGGILILSKGPCVGVMTLAGFDQWVGYLRSKLPTSGFQDLGAHLSYAHAQASRFKPDVQGRFQLSDRLRFAAAIERDVTVVGVGRRIELWNPANYGLELDEYRQNLEFLQDGFDLVEDGSW